MNSFDTMPTVRTPEASRQARQGACGIPPSPLRNKVSYFHHVRFRGYFSVHFRFGLLSPCLRFAVAVTGHHARLGSWLLARLYHGGHFRPQNFMRLQGAILAELSVILSHHSAPIIQPRVDSLAPSEEIDQAFAWLFSPTDESLDDNDP